MKRRDFLAALSAGTLARAVSVEPELVLWNGNIHTMDTANPHAEAVALAGGRFLAAGSYTAEDANEIAVADINGDGKPDILVSTGVSHPVQAGVVTNGPGVLLQSTTTPGTFGALQDLP